MMGNVFEWVESPWTSGGYGTGSDRGLRGGSYEFFDYTLGYSYRFIYGSPSNVGTNVGFRVAQVPEPATLALLALAGLALIRRRRA